MNICFAVSYRKVSDGHFLSWSKREANILNFNGTSFDLVLWLSKLWNLPSWKLLCNCQLSQVKTPLTVTKELWQIHNRNLLCFPVACQAFDRGRISVRCNAEDARWFLCLFSLSSAETCFHCLAAAVRHLIFNRSFALVGVTHFFHGQKVQTVALKFSDH